MLAFKRLIQFDFCSTIQGQSYKGTQAQSRKPFCSVPLALCAFVPQAVGFGRQLLTFFSASVQIASNLPLTA
jgi:hypothetical protein